MTTSSGPTADLQRQGPLVLSAFLTTGVLFVAIYLAIMKTGPFADEFFTLYVTQPGASFAAMWRHWLSDNHPPLFYVLSWLCSWLGDWVIERRALNLVVFVAAALALVELAVLQPAWRRRIILFAFGLMGTYPIIERAATLRSFFLALAASAVASVALAQFAQVARPAGPSKRLLAILVVALMVALNAHYVTTLLIAALAAAFWLNEVMTRDWKKVAVLTGAGFVAALPLVATLAAQYATLESNTRAFWIPGGFTAARWAIQAVAEDALTANAVLSLAGLAGMAVMLRSAVRDRRFEPDARLLVTLGAGFALGIACLLAAHSWRPLIMQAYLVAIYPPIMLALAIGVDHAFARLGRRAEVVFAVLLPIATVVSISHHLNKTIARPSWNEAPAAIAAQRQLCRQTIVHVDLAASAKTASLPPVDNARAFAWAFGQTAAQWGIPIEPQGSRRMASGCPTLFWADLTDDRNATADQIAQRLTRQGYHLGAVSLRHFDFGWVLTSAPDPLVLTPDR